MVTRPEAEEGAKPPHPKLAAPPPAERVEPSEGVSGDLEEATAAGFPPVSKTPSPQRVQGGAGAAGLTDLGAGRGPAALRLGGESVRNRGATPKCHHSCKKLLSRKA